MSTTSPELERAIRDALQSEQIDERDLIYPTLRSSAPRNRRTLLAVFATAAVVGAVAVVAGVFTAGTNRTHTAANGDPLAGVAGYRWRVTHIVDADGAFDVPASLKAEVDITRDGHVFGNDTVNELQGNYTTTSDGYTVYDVASTAVGVVADPHSVRGRTISAVDAMFLIINETPPPRFVNVTLGDDRMLSLEHDDIQVTLTRLGPQPDYSAIPVAPTTRATS